jgi:aminocarboxymuconate-semialdehyde decarboxylase
MQFTAKTEVAMPTRREFLEKTAAAAGMLATGRGLTRVFAQAPPAAAERRVVTVAGKRVKVIDVHAHADIPEVGDVLKGTPLARNVSTRLRLTPDRISLLDKRGIDIQVLDINDFWWYAADRDLATKIVDVHNQGLAAWCSKYPDRFVAVTSPALQFPDLAAQQLEHAVKDLKMRGAAVGPHVQGEPLSSPKYDPFWAKAQELGVMVFVHPLDVPYAFKQDVLKGRGDLNTIIGMPIETSLALTQLIFDGTFDRFPGLKICAAHGGGYLASYLGRTEVTCTVRGNANCANKKKPSEYLKTQIFVDSMVFSSEGIRHLVAEIGASQIVYGTDGPSLTWPDSIDTILAAQITNAEKEAILGGNLPEY